MVICNSASGGGRKALLLRTIFAREVIIRSSPSAGLRKEKRFSTACAKTEGVWCIQGIVETWRSILRPDFYPWRIKDLENQDLTQQMST